MGPCMMPVNAQHEGEFPHRHTHTHTDTHKQHIKKKICAAHLKAYSSRVQAVMKVVFMYRGNCGLVPGLLMECVHTIFAEKSFQNYHSTLCPSHAQRHKGYTYLDTVHIYFLCCSDTCYIILHIGNVLAMQNMFRNFKICDPRNVFRKNNFRWHSDQLKSRKWSDV